MIQYQKKSNKSNVIWVYTPIKAKVVIERIYRRGLMVCPK
jgi:hypothetical protein